MNCFPRALPLTARFSSCGQFLIHRQWGCFPRHCGFSPRGEIDAKGRSLSRVTLNGNTSPVARDNAMNDRQAHTTALPNRFGGKKGLKDMRERLRSNTTTGVTYG